MIKTIAIKDLKLFFSDKKSVIITFVLPILLITLFAFAFGGFGSSDEVKKIDLLITDLDNSKESIALKKSLDSIEGIHLIETTLDRANDAVKKGKYVAVLVLKNGFQKAVDKSEPIPIELKYDQSRKIEVGMLQAVLMEKLMQKVSKNAIQKNIENLLDKEFAGMPPSMKKRILDKAKAQFAEHTDITFEYEIVGKIGKKVTHLKFTIKQLKSIIILLYHVPLLPLL